MNTNPAISVIIVNYNSVIHTLECIASLQKQQQVDLHIIVIDNDSPEKDWDRLSKEFKPAEITLIKNSINAGFGRANNIAFSSVQSEYLLLLNPDTTLTDPLTLHTLLEALNANPEIGMVAPGLHVARRNRILGARKRYPEQKQVHYTRDLRELPGDVAWVAGACMLMRSDLYRELKGFDQDFFMYGEDVDLCLRLRKKGYSIVCREDIVIEHISGASESKTIPYEKWMRKRSGKFLFILKNYDLRDARAIFVRLMRKSQLRGALAKIRKLFNIGRDDTAMHAATIAAAKQAIALCDQTQPPHAT